MQLIKKIDRILDKKNGYVEWWDNSKANLDYQSRIDTITKIASICYGKDEAKYPEKLFNRLMKESKGLPSSSFEFVPVLLTYKQIQYLSYKQIEHMGKTNELFIPHILKYGQHVYENGKHYWLTNFRAILYDYNKLQPDIDMTQWFNTEEECRIIEKYYHLFKVEIDIVTARQWVRSRSLSFQEISRRFTKSKPKFYFPKEFNCVYTQDVFYNFQDIANYEMLVNNYYQKALDNMPAQKARYILPLGLMTTLWVGGYKNDWKNFLALRMDKHAQEEIRMFAQTIDLLLKGNRCDTL